MLVYPVPQEGQAEIAKTSHTVQYSTVQYKYSTVQYQSLPLLLFGEVESGKGEREYMQTYSNTQNNTTE